jgi:transposase
MAGTEPHAWETGRMNSVTYVVLDVHKATATVSVAVAESGRGGEIRQLGVFENRPEVLSKLAARLSNKNCRVSFCYEAGPCGYGLHHLLTSSGHDCVVVALSLIPMKAGDRVKTDAMLGMKRCGTWCARGRRQAGYCLRRGSICRVFCCAMTGSTADFAPGLRRIDAG